MTPNAGYGIANVTGCGGSLSGNTYTTGAITGACTVSATFSQSTYTVTGTAGAGGFFNQDIKADLIFRNADNHELWVVYMDGAVPTGVDFAGHIPVAEWKLITVADYNGNGLSDTLWMHVPTRTLIIALNRDHLFSELGLLFELPDEWEVKE